MSETQTASAHPAFEWLREQHIPSLNLTFQEYRHRVTGAQHIHLHADNSENVFLVALRTVPMDSTGVAHILEHTALCGSEKFPVRDPFFMMIRRSLNTFMNAFTSSDWTAYPFASQNRKDFNNLLEVYLDSVFFARLDPLDFAQEGHRVEFAEPADSGTPLEYKGVVYNEMKGAMSSVNSVLWQTMSRHLYPTTTYHYNSGGEPADIPSLNYDQFKAFYQRHYHPSNAIFITYGDIAASEHQGKFENLALSRFEALDCHIGVDPEQRYSEPQQFREPYAADSADDSSRRSHVVLAWLLGDSTDLAATMRARLLSSVLFDNSASPLQKLLETTDLGLSPSPMCGLEDSQREICFACGIEGADDATAEQSAEALEQQVLATLTDVANNGLPYSQVAASLHQLELQQREISGGGYPYGLHLILTALTSATHRGDPVALLDLDPVLAELKESIKNPEFIKQLVREQLLDNPHRIRLLMTPDEQLNARNDAAERARLDALAEQLTEADKQTIIDRAAALKARQEQVEDMDILPKVGREDIPAAIHYVEPIASSEKPLALTQYGAGTNGLVYQQLVMPLPQLSEELFALLPLYAACVTELGVGERDYLSTQLWHSELIGSWSAAAGVRADKANANHVAGTITFSAKGLADNQAQICALMNESINTVRFDELERIRELIAQMRAHREAGLVGSGHLLAMAAASAPLSRFAAINQQWNGTDSVIALKALDKTIEDPAALQQLAEQFAAIHQQVLAQPRRHLLVAEPERLTPFAQTLTEQFADDTQSHWQRPNLHQPGKATPANPHCWAINSTVSYCARAYPTVSIEHPDAAPLAVLGGLLRNGYLHRAIREQGGAYGAGAGQDNMAAAFRFFSYRDPRIEGTLTDFDKAIEWVTETAPSQEAIDEAVLGVISAMDKPGTPAGEAIQAFHSELSGRNKADIEHYRAAVLAVSAADLQRVAAHYLTADKANTAVLTGAKNAEQTGWSTTHV